MSILNQTPQSNLKMNQTVTNQPVDWWKAPSPSPEAARTHEAMLSTISEFLKEYPASVVAGMISLTVSRFEDQTNPNVLNLVHDLTELSAFITMISELQADLAYMSLRDCNVRE